MRVAIRHKNFEMTPALEDYIEKKITAPVRKFLKSPRWPDLPMLDIEVIRTTRHHRKGQVWGVTATLTIGKALLRAEAEDEDARIACDEAEQEIKREIEKYKSRNAALLKRGAREMKRELRFTRPARLPAGTRVRNEGN